MAKNEFDGYKIVDLEKNGNVVRFYLAKNEKLIEDSWGDDWNDAPYEHNAGTIYDNFVEKAVDVFFAFDDIVAEPSEDYFYQSNTPFCKEDFKNKVTPRLCILSWKDTIDDCAWYDSSNYHLMLDKPMATKVYYGDEIKKVLDICSGYEEIIDRSRI